MRARIDLNGDVGESFGAWTLGNDSTFLPLLSSANIACGFHAGDPSVMRRTVILARDHGVSIGAHIGLPDLQGFGRRAMQVSAQEVYDLTLYQIAALAGIARSLGAAVVQVKPHGALYHQVSQDRGLADGLASAVRDADPRLLLVGASGSQLPAAGRALGLRVAHEVFADRVYAADGSLLARREPGALIEDPQRAADQAAAFALGRSVAAADRTAISLTADTVCLHGDRIGAVEFARALRARLAALGIEVRALDQ